MKRSKAKLLSAIIAVAIVLNCGIVALAAAHTEYPWGGTWNWGEREESGVKYAYSEYYLTANDEHYTNGIHKTTVTGKTSDTSDWVDPGKWAKSKIPCKWNAIERCFYNAKDKNGNPKG